MQETYDDIICSVQAWGKSELCVHRVLCDWVLDWNDNDKDNDKKHDGRTSFMF